MNCIGTMSSFIIPLPSREHYNKLEAALLAKKKSFGCCRKWGVSITLVGAPLGNSLLGEGSMLSKT